MIVFTLTNKVSEEVWVGTTREDVPPAERFEQFKDALHLEIDHQFYKDLKVFGDHNFELSEFAAADSREELKELFEEAMETYDGKSLAGVKIVKPGATRAALTAPIKTKPRVAKTASTSNLTTSANPSSTNNASNLTSKIASNGIRSGRSTPSTMSRVATSPVKEKLSSGRTGSAKREKNIREAIEAEKAQIAADKAKRAMEQADEMKAILAALDSRGSTLKKR